MKKLWERIDGESAKAFMAFAIYLETGRNRSLRKAAEKMDYSLRQLERWSSKFEWQKRILAYESWRLAKAIENRTELQEKVRQQIIDRAGEAADVLFELLFGHCDGGSTIPKCDRDGKIIGNVPIVKPGTRLQAALRALEFAGITIPKRIELSGPDGKELLISARAAIAQLSDTQISALMDVFGTENESK